MGKKAYYILSIIIFFLIVFAIARIFSGEDDWICQNGEWVKHGNPQAEKPSGGCGEQEQIVGGDKDEHGCVGSAGYSWCESKQKCLRIWEEDCEK